MWEDTDILDKLHLFELVATASVFRGELTDFIKQVAKAVTPT